MKTLIPFILLVFVTNAAHAQLNEPNYIDIGPARNPNSAQTGLNTGAGSWTNIQLVHRDWSGSHGILFNSYMSATQVNGSLSALGNTKYANNVGSHNGGAGAIMFFGNGGIMDFFISPASTGQNTNIAWGTPKLRIKRNGDVGINTTNPTEKLTVNGNIKSKEVIVSANAGADFVFNKKYELPPLSKLKQEIATLQHLPGIPSAEDMKQNGVQVGHLQIKLLQKVEELTLYTIRMNERMGAMQKENKQLKTELHTLKEKVKTLQKRRFYRPPGISNN